MTKKCCSYHNKMQYRMTDLSNCGMAGNGNAVVCCPDCELVEWYRENQPTRKIDFYTDDIKKGLTFEE